jgi:hypothetical protein
MLHPAVTGEEGQGAHGSCSPLVLQPSAVSPFMCLILHCEPSVPIPGDLFPPYAPFVRGVQVH